MSKDKHIARIQKLLNLGKSSSVHEAASALEKAQELMREYAVTEMDIREAMIGEAKIKSTVSVSKPKTWEANLIFGIADAFGCKVLWQPSNSRMYDYYGRYILLGEKTQIILAEYAAEVLLREATKARNKYREKLKSYPRNVISRELDTFSIGWTTTIRKKVRVFANAPEVQVLIDARFNRQGKEQDPVKTDRKQGGSHHSAKYGAAMAGSVELNHGVGEKEKFYLE